MATGRPQDAICRIVKHRILELETKGKSISQVQSTYFKHIHTLNRLIPQGQIKQLSGRKPDYNGVLMIDGMLLVVDWKAYNLQIYNGHDGKRITSHRLESIPYGVCRISKNKVAVCLDYGKVVILSLKSIDDVKLVKTLKTEFRCYSLAKWNSDKLVVGGWKYGMLCWGILSITDGRMDSTHDICKGYHRTHMAVKDNTVYISCRTYDSITNGVYAYDLSNPQTLQFLYQHQELQKPGSIMADRDYVYVCDYNSNRIHQLTDSGQLVTIHTVSSSLFAIFYDDRHGLLYTTSVRSNVITVYKMESLHQPGTAIPDKTKNKVDREDQKEKSQPVLGETRASEQAKVSQKQEAKISPFRPMISVDPVEQVTQTLSETDIHGSLLGRLSKDLICNDWKFFFRELSVTDEEIKQIEFDNRHYGVREQIYQLLHFSNKKGILNKRSIIDALQSIDRVDLVTKYKLETFPDN